MARLLRLLKPPPVAGLGSFEESGLRSLPRACRSSQRATASVLIAIHLFLITGCSGWFRTGGAPLPTPLPDHAQVWAADTSVEVRNLTARGDSLLGELKSDRGKEAPRNTAWRVADVDSLRVKQISASRTVLAAFGVLSVFVAFLFLTRGSGEAEL